MTNNTNNKPHKRINRSLTTSTSNSNNNTKNPRTADALLLIIFSTSLVITECTLGNPKFLGKFALWGFDDVRHEFAWSFLVHSIGFILLLLTTTIDNQNHPSTIPKPDFIHLLPGLIFFYSLETFNYTSFHFFYYTYGFTSLLVIYVLYAILVGLFPIVREILRRWV
jgi:hypothetical protein